MVSTVFCDKEGRNEKRERKEKKRKKQLLSSAKLNLRRESSQNHTRVG